MDDEVKKQRSEDGKHHQNRPEEETGTVPLSEFRRVYAEMKKWKEKYRSMLGKEELLREREEELKRLRNVIYEMRVSKALVDAASEEDAVDPQQVAHLLKKYVQLNDNLEPIVVDEEGKRRFTRGGQELTLKGLVKEFLARYPHHRRARSQGGAGSIPFAKKSERPLIERIETAQSLRELERIIKEDLNRRLEG